MRGASGAVTFNGNPHAMQLMMYIGNDLIEAVPLDHEKVPVPGYLGNVKRHLKEKYQTLIQESPTPVEFLVVPQNRDRPQT